MFNYKSKSTFAYIALVALLTVTSFFSLNLFLRQRTDRDRLDIRTFPYAIGEWKGKDLKITEPEYRILETRNLILREYINAAQQRLFLFIVYSETNRLVFHPPEVCIIGSGATIDDKKSERINAGKFEFLANELHFENKNNRQIALYCYKAGDYYTGNYYLQQAYFAFHQLLGTHKGGATIRVSMPVLDNEKTTLATLKGFMKTTIVRLEEL